MTDIYLLGTDVYNLVLRIKSDPPTLRWNCRLRVIYKIFPAELKVPGYFLRTLLLVSDSEGVSAYLLRKNSLHREFPIDYEFCERLLLHLAGKPLDTRQLGEIRLWSSAYPSGRASVQEFQDIEHVGKLQVQIHDEGLPPLSLDDKLPRRYRGSEPKADNTSELPE